MKTKILFLDDDIRRIEVFRNNIPWSVIVSEADECITELDNNEWDYVFLDHDLGGETYMDPNLKNCGMEVVRWIIKNKPIINNLIIHSHNYPCAMEMNLKLCENGYDSIYLPFAYFEKTYVYSKIKELENER